MVPISEPCRQSSHGPIQPSRRSIADLRHETTSLIVIFLVGWVLVEVPCVKFGPVFTKKVGNSYEAWKAYNNQIQGS